MHGKTEEESFEVFGYVILSVVLLFHFAAAASVAQKTHSISSVNKNVALNIYLATNGKL